MSNSYTFAWQVTNVSLRLTGLTVVSGQGNLVINRAPGVGTYGTASLNQPSGFPVVAINAEVGLYDISTRNSITSYTMENLITVPNSAFSNGTDALFSLQSVNFPSVTSVGNTAFKRCGIITVNLPNVTTLGSYTFEQCSILVNVNIPKVTSIPTECFRSAGVSSSGLEVSCPLVTAVGYQSFIFSEIKSIYFAGSPPTVDFNGFAGLQAPLGTVYYNTGTTGWPTTAATFGNMSQVAVTPISTIIGPLTTLTSSGQVTLRNTQTFGSLTTTYQWYRNGVAISGATSATYALVASTDVGKTIQLQITNLTGTGTANYFYERANNGSLVKAYKIVSS